MEESFYNENTYKLSEKKHCYGDKVHILDDPYSLTLLSILSSPNTNLILLTHIIKRLYMRLTGFSLNYLFDKNLSITKTRMFNQEKEGIFKGQIFNQNIKAITVDLARAGMIPSQIVFEELSYILNLENIRQDHFYAARKVDDNEQVVGVDISGSKIGGEIDDHYIFFPDPMGATGNTISHALKIYKNEVKGEAKKFITLHLIITPEYIQNIKRAHPDVEIFALRLDRGLSTKTALKSIPGTYPDEERGLNAKQYIVPGAGGIGELLNNSFV